ncbi:MAG: phosphoribosyl-ATP diphosphatase [Deltaproteobacteria bacterium]|nr:phosphoribosyl-ATP diphosphatase [Deltaproteobacteria bacterium]
MIVPSIDIMDGQAVQLVGGKKKAIEAGDPVPIAERFSLVGEIAVIDLDAALGRGSNEGIIRDLVRRFPCRVGGGIRDVDSAVRWLDDGARKVIIGTAAAPEVLSRLPPERVIAALDARHGEVVVEGWRKGTGRGVIERVAELKDLVGGFLVTFVEREGRMEGIDLDEVARIVDAAGSVRVTAAGGVTTTDEIAALDGLGADAQVGMAIYSGKLDLVDAFLAPARSDRPDGLWPTVVVDEQGRALGLAYSDAGSVREAVRTRRGAYRSRTRGLWIKGETSGATQDLLRVDLDCDRDALRFTVRQNGPGFCHTDTWTCWGEDRGLSRLERVLHERLAAAPGGSYTRRLLDEPDLLRSKLLEEAAELAEAGPEGVAHEAADVVYFTMTAMARAGVRLEDVEAELDRRSLGLTRRPGDAKPERG